MKEREKSETANPWGALFRLLPVMSHVVDSDMRILDVSDYWLERLGYERAEVIGRRSVEFLTEASRRHVDRVSRPEALRTGGARNVPLTFVTKSGEELEVLLSAVHGAEARDGFNGAMAVLVDITEQKRAEESLARLASFPEDNPNPVIEGGAGGRFYANHAAYHLFPELASLDGSHPVFRGLEEAKDAPCPCEVEIKGRVYERRALRKGGVWRLYLNDLTERKRAEETLLRLSSFPEENPSPVIEAGAGGHFYANPAARRLFPELASLDRSHPVFRGIEETAKDAPCLCEVEIEGRVYERRALRRDGVWRVYLNDLTDHRRLEAVAFQAEKLSAVGRLSAGIAHDFNNLLTGILGYAQMLADSLAADDPRRQEALEILAISERAAELVAQLMAFSRQSVLKPKTLSLNKLVLNLHKMLRRIIAEDVELVILPQAACDRILADPRQIERLAVNLAVNARDAMPGGGKLIVETSEVVLDEEFERAHSGAQAGPHVVLSVSDTGTGLSPQAKAHLFEPFFTTKEQGKGTGLGLAACLGIVQQSGGVILAYSEPGRGTTFKIFLPRSEGELDSCSEKPLGPPPRGTETILLVEDDASLRSLVCRHLGALGYRVLAASNGSEALSLVEELGSSGAVDMLFSDVVMPLMGGMELARRLRANRPGLKVLFTSGYSQAAVAAGGSLEPGTYFLEKPYHAEAVAFKVREVLDQV